MVSIHCTQFLFVKKTYKIDKKLILNCSKFFVRESKELPRVLQLLSVKTVYVLEANVSLKRSLYRKCKKCNIIVEITVISSLVFSYRDDSCG